MKNLIVSLILIFSLFMCAVSCGGGEPQTSDPVSSGEPSSPVAPSESSTPIESDDPAESITPTESSSPSESSDPAESITPTESSRPAESSDPVESITPTESSTPTESGGTALTLREVCGLLNKLSAQSYGKIKLDITTVTGGITLNASYTITKDSVAYSVERLNKLPTDGSFDNVSPDYKRTVTGTATVKNGEIVSFDGEEVTLPQYNELKGGFSFDEDNLENVLCGEGLLNADVISPSELLGVNKEMSDMTVSVEYSDTSLHTVTVTYKTSGSSVTTVYEFEK